MSDLFSCAGLRRAAVPPLARSLVLAALLALLGACGGRAAPSAPTPASSPAAPLLAAPTPTPSAPATPVLTEPTAAAEPTTAAGDAYRAWMEQARQAHPYGEPLEEMWAVMLCESSGDATVVAGEHYGLFQYSSETWAGAWNPYRDEPILDPRAQIFATAKAWQDGYRSWWGC